MVADKDTIKIVDRFHFHSVALRLRERGNEGVVNWSMESDVNQMEIKRDKIH